MWHISLRLSQIIEQNESSIKGINLEEEKSSEKLMLGKTL